MHAHSPAPVIRTDPGLFLAQLEVSSKPELFTALVATLAERNLARHREALLRVLLEREAIGTTGLGWGIALPHVRSHVVGATAVSFARLRQPLDFGAADGAPVQVAVLLVAPYGTAGAAYGPLLAVLAAAIHDPEGRRRLLAVESFEDFDRLMKEAIQPRLAEVLA